MDTNSRPKVELHCHLDYLVDPAMLRALRAQGHDVPVNAEALEATYPVRTVADWNAWELVAKPLEGSLTWFAPIAALHVERLRAQRVEYAELMISPSEVPWNTPDTSLAVERVGAFRRVLDEAERRDAADAGAAGDRPTHVELLILLNRRYPLESVAAQARAALALYEAGLTVGVAFAGPEEGHPVRPLRDLFARLHETGMGIEIHAGEWTGPDSGWDALEYGLPDRLGHGTRLFEDPRLIDVIHERGVHLEMCPSANVITVGLAHVGEHPIGRARDLGLNFSVNTDIPGPAGCSMNAEYALLERVFGFTAADFERLYTRSLAARFGPRRRTPLSE